MHAYDRFLPEWFSRIRSRQVTLVRLRRFNAWGHREVSGLLTTVLRGLPCGATLILEVGDQEKFVSRTIDDVPESCAKVTEQLLDGHQRLLALWLAFHDKYPDRTYLIGFMGSRRDADTRRLYVCGQARWQKNERRYPRWVDAPAACWSRQLMPIRLLRPEDVEDAIDQWVEQAMPNDAADRLQTYRALRKIINDLRTQVREFNLPYLALPANTPKGVALHVLSR